MKIYNNILKEFLQKHWAVGVVLILSVSNCTASHGWHFTAYEDHVAGRSIVYNTRYTANAAAPIKGKTEIVAYEFGTDISQTPTEHVLYSIEGCGSTETGELQISPKGDKLLWYQHDKNISGFSHRLADIYTFELNTSKTGFTENINIVHSSQSGNYGKGMAEFMANNDDILYSQRGVYKEGTGATQYEKNVWKYVKVPSTITQINALDPTTTYLFSEIRRGVDNQYYMPNMGEPADKIHSYSGTAFNANVNLGEAGNELASSLPTQVYKVFADPTQIPTDNKRSIGNKIYAITDHQNSQRLSISDEKLVVDANTNNVIDNGDVFTPSVKSYSDFFPMGGMPMPTRTYNANSTIFGYQGQLKINEVYGDANVNEFKYRDSDARKGGDFPTPDPLSEKYPQCSPYQFSERRVIDGLELEGLEQGGFNEASFKSKYGLVITLKTPSSEGLDINQENAKQAAHNSNTLNPPTTKANAYSSFLPPSNNISNVAGIIDDGILGPIEIGVSSLAGRGATLGTNGKIYTSGPSGKAFFGNQYTSTLKFSKIAYGLKAIGTTANAIGTLGDIKDYNSGAIGPAHFLINGALTGVGLFSTPVGIGVFLATNMGKTGQEFNNMLEGLDKINRDKELKKSQDEMTKALTPPVISSPIPGTR